ncbi:MAG: Txe/YoeB family addiction module toxin [Gammaproteobacteria bacterium]
MNWWVVFAADAVRDVPAVLAAGYKARVTELLALLGRDPFETAPPYVALRGDLKGAYSRRLDLQQRLVYEVLREERVVRVLRLWTGGD